jgi:hypothetical protein
MCSLSFLIVEYLPYADFNQPLFGSTAFVMGPQKQLRMMFDPVRLYATAIYVGCVVLALIFALWVRKIFELFLFFFSLMAFFL